MARSRATRPELLISVMRPFTPETGSDHGFSLGGTIATLALAAALSVFAGPKIAGAIKRRIVEADGAAQRLASSIESFFDRLPALQGDLAEVPGPNASDRPLPDAAPHSGFPSAPFIVEDMPPRFRGLAVRPLYQPYCRPFRCVPQGELPPAWRGPSRKRHRRRQPQTRQPPDRLGE